MPWPEEPFDATVAERVRDVAGRATATIRWPFLVAGIAAASLIAAAPDYRLIAARYMNAARQRGLHPFVQPAYAPGSHEEKLAFRLVVPLTARLLGGHDAVYVGLSVLSAFATLACLLVLLRRWTTPTAAALFTAAAAFTFGGGAGFLEYSTVFDGPALFFVVAALLLVSTRPTAAAALVFLGAWTDERAVLAAGFVILAPFVLDREKPWRAAAIASSGLAAYVLTRVAMTVAYEFQQPVGGVGVGVLAEQLRTLPVGAWSGIEGLWAVLIAGAVALWRRSPIVSAAFVGTALLIIGAATVVYDQTRSFGYLLPGAAVGTLALRHLGVRLERLLASIAIVCLAAPAIYVERVDIYWLYPLPIHVLRMIAGVV